MNCGYILQAVKARLHGTTATLPIDYPGPISLSDIENTLSVTTHRKESLAVVFDEVRNSYAGSIALVVLVSPWQYGHAVLITNQQNQAVLIEGQQWGEKYPADIYTDAEEATKRYGADAEVWMGYLPTN